MKNNYLKKAGAVALAAVMAVTFAPVASLNVFANVGVTGNNEIKTNNAYVDEAGTYTITTSAAITTVVSGSAAKGNYIFDVSKCSKGWTLRVEATTSTAINITIKGSKNVGDKTWDYGHVKSITGPSLAVDDDEDKLSISFSGDLVVDDTNDDYWSTQEKNLGSNAVATIDAYANKYFIGNNAINDFLANKNGNVEAVNGAVNVKALPSGYSAKVAGVANADTTVEAATDAKVSLTKIERVYNYTYHNTTTGIKGLPGKYAQNEFYAGYTPAATAIKNLKTTVTGSGISERYSDRTVDRTNSYENKITVKIDGDESWKDKTVAGYPADVTKQNSTVAAWTHGMTYYTMDPTSFTDSADGIALFDGNEYVVDNYNTKELEAESMEAASSIKILRGTESEATDGNDNAYNKFYNGYGVTVTAPADESVFSVDYDWVSGLNKGTIATYYVFGKNRTSDGKGDVESVLNIKRSSERTANALNVTQIASGTAIELGKIENRVTLNRADGIGYYTKDKGLSDEKNVFGQTKEVTEAFVNEFKTKKSGIFVVGGAFNSGDIYASKEIKTTVTGIDPDVKITGEINADVVATAADGTKTWDVNTNAAQAQAQVVAYRMYRKSGEHVYTINPAEVSMLEAAGWKNEGVAFTVNSVASGKGTPIYRVYNPNNGGMHFYTANAAERDMLLKNGWTEGATVFYGAEKGTGLPVYRTYNTGSNNGEHNYTTNIAESDMNVKAGWRAEGVAFYVFK